MKVVRLIISNFRGIKSAEFLFDGHTLMVGSNNVGKSTLCEALDLVLGPDRLNRFPPVDEFDFYNAEYLAPAAEEGAERVPTPLRIEAVLIEPGAEIEAKCGGNIEFWHVAEQRLLGPGEADAANPPHAVPCLRIETIGQYNPEEDEFEARTYFSHSPDAPPGELTKLPKPIKRLFGFLYLRALRTGSRALSLERGSLLDIILRTKGVRTSLWEKTIERLRGLDIEADAAEIAPVLRSVERRLARYIALESPGNATKLHVSELTREHLRKTMTFFLALSADQGHVPFPHAGTGTINTLVLALLSFIADLKPDTVNVGKPVRHKLLFDEAEALLSARFAAFLLEPKDLAQLEADVATSMEMIAAARRATGQGRKEVAKLLEQANKIKGGKALNINIANALRGLISGLAANDFSGDPAEDWLTVKHELRSTNQDELTRVAAQLDFLVAFHRGHRISAALSDEWLRDGAYPKSRRVLRVGITRAKVHTLILDPLWPQCPLLKGHKL